MDNIWHGRNEKKRPVVRKHPVIDWTRCTDCESCIELCPGIFRRNRETGYIEIVDVPQYPEEAVREAINMCPADCISWEEE